MFFKRMKWQDRVFSLGEVVFIIGLLPSVFSEGKPAALTSLVTALTLCTFLFVHASYKLWGAFILCTITTGLWFTLFVQAL